MARSCVLSRATVSSQDLKLIFVLMHHLQHPADLVHSCILWRRQEQVKFLSQQFLLVTCYALPPFKVIKLFVMYSFRLKL
jgi:hypothetical protein